MYLQSLKYIILQTFRDANEISGVIQLIYICKSVDAFL